jgi:glucose/arabinose dehydrogenase
MRRIAFACALAVAAACSGDSATTPTPPSPAPGTLKLTPIAAGLDAPLFVTAPPADPRLFVVEQGGRIRLIKGGTLQSTPFLDISGTVASGGERGLLGLAFHPMYATNGRFFVYYTAPSGDVTLAEYHVSADPDVADPSGTVLLTIPHRDYANHNGGMLAFGPDGKLYMGTGDGGGGGDPLGNAQRISVLLGKILRLDVDGGAPYAVPTDNPFAGSSAGRGEIWSYGLRNPWRFSFDRQSGDLYIGDVGQDLHEEVDVATAASGRGKGLNFGWNLMEGLSCYRDDACDKSGLTLPVLDYDHTNGCSVTGGYVYRGAAIPSLAGTYFYGDYCGGWVRSFRYQNGTAGEQQEWPGLHTASLTSFGEDAAGELYIVSGSGTVGRIDAAP